MTAKTPNRAQQQSAREPHLIRARGMLAAALVATTALGGSAFVWARSAAATGASPSAAINAPEVAAPLPGSFAALVQEVSPAVVNIAVTAKSAGEVRELPELPPGVPLEEFYEHFGMPFGQPDQRGPRGRTMGQGSGFIIEPDGYIVTNDHVVADASEITVTLADGTNLEATLVGRDPRTDLALLKVEPDEPLPYLSFGDSEDVQIGDWVVAVGNPFGLGGTVTAGIVSGRGRDLNAGPYDDYLQIDAPINRGNSGGPTFDLDGEVIGINSAIFSPNGGSVGIGFAIPADLAEPVIAELREQGHVERGWLGVRIQPVNAEIAASLGLQAAQGAIVAAVVPDSPAAESGLEPGDVILSFNGEAVDDARSLSRLVAETDEGTEGTLEVWRDGYEESVSVDIGAIPDEQVASVAPHDEEEVLGLQLARLDPAMRRRLGLEDSVDGVVVLDSSGGPADQVLRPGDVILKVGGHEVTSPDDVATGVQEAKSDGRPSVLLLIHRQGGESFVTVPIEQA